MLKGEIWLVDLRGGVGSEQGGVRPCLIIQNDIGNMHSPTTIVCPITKRGKKFNRTHMAINCLKVPSYVLFEQMRVVDKSRMLKYIISLDVDYHPLIDAKIALTLAV